MSEFEERNERRGERGEKERRKRKYQKGVITLSVGSAHVLQHKVALGVADSARVLVGPLN
jgi:hypothetical protein